MREEREGRRVRERGRQGRARGEFAEAARGAAARLGAGPAVPDPATNWLPSMVKMPRTIPTITTVPSTMAPTRRQTYGPSALNAPLTKKRSKATGRRPSALRP